MHPLNFSRPASTHAARARELILPLRETLANGLAACGIRSHGEVREGASHFWVEWLRDDGRHGGGNRQVWDRDEVFLSASLNFSQVHYDDLPDKTLGSATALSCIIHPNSPSAPSLHMHLSWTEMKDGGGSWRLMADLNPSIAIAEDTGTFNARMEQACDPRSGEARQRGDDYFFISPLKRHRGEAHYYFERFMGATFDAGLAFVEGFGVAAIEAYVEILDRRILRANEPRNEQIVAQRSYHTLYLYQVLTLDRGTTSGLLVHDQNDEGVLGSLPPVVDVALLESWASWTPKPQDELVLKLCEVLRAHPEGEVDAEKKTRFAEILRRHYAEHPEALGLQAGDSSGPLATTRHASES
jgi:coproporphyrinogen III oxidase